MKTMTLEELENALPNSLHDSKVKRIGADYQPRSLVLGGRLEQGQCQDFAPGETMDLE